MAETPICGICATPFQLTKHGHMPDCKCPNENGLPPNTACVKTPIPSQAEMLQSLAMSARHQAEHAEALENRLARESAGGVRLSNEMACALLRDLLELKDLRERLAMQRTVVAAKVETSPGYGAGCACKPAAACSEK
jgi:hypothetical protein